MEPRRYRNFTLRISPVAGRPGRYHIEIFGLIPGGQPASDEGETMIYDPAAFAAGNLNLLDAVQFGQMTTGQLYELGSVLGDMLLAGSIRERWWDSLNVTRERQLGLRLRLLFDAPELIGLPWEFLYLRPPWENSDSELYFLGLQADVSIVRHETLDIAEPSLKPQMSYRLVAAQASPSDQPLLALGMERKAIEAAIAKLPQSGLLQPAWVEKATKRALREALRTPADILHFSGHGRVDGSGGQILLEQDKGGSDSYAATSLASLVQASPLRLAILNACETGARSGNNPWNGVASALVRVGVAAVVASQYPILDTNATPLAEEIYLGVLKGLTIDEVVSNARRAIYQETGLQITDWGAPVLYLRAEEGLIFPPVPASTEAHPSAPQIADRQINIQVTQTITGPVSGTVSGVNAGSIGTQIATSVNQAVSGGLSGVIPRILPPRRDSPFLGRDEELSQAESRLESGGKYYFYGTYGVGKTSLAAELCRRLLEKKGFDDGCLWDRVSRLSAEKVLDRVAGRLSWQKVAEAAGLNEKIQALNDLLVGRNDMLIALDEVDNRKVAQALFQAVGDCTLILNGSQRLNLAGTANEHRLQPLQPAVAAGLFRVLARPSGAAFSEEEAALVTDICRMMRYLPLAVKLASLKYAEGVESMEELRDRLASEPETLSPEGGVVAIFKAHYDDLKTMPTALSLLVRIAGFPAREASLKALQEGQADFYSSKDKLVDLGLVDYAGPGRLLLHPLLGNQVQLVEPQAIAKERERAAHWLRDYAGQNRGDYEALECEHANLLAQLDRYVDERRGDVLVDLLRDLFDYLRVRGQWQEIFERLDAVIALAGEVAKPWNIAWVYLHRGIMHLLRAHYDQAEGDFDRACQFFADNNDQVYQGIVNYQYGRLYGVKGNLDSARNHLEKALQLMGQEGPAHERVGALDQMAGIFAIQGDATEAQKYYGEALRLCRSSGEREKEAHIHLALGTLARKAGDLPGARRHIEYASQLAEKLGDLLQLASIKQELGYFNYYQGRYEEAESAFNEALNVFQQLKYPRGLGQVFHALGNVALAHKNKEEASRQYGEALKINQTLGHKAAEAYNLYQLGVVASREGLLDQAEAYYKKALDAVQNENLKDVVLQAAAWFQLSKLALSQNDFKHARQYTERAKALAAQGQHRFTEGAALYQMGLLQAKEGQLEMARDNMVLAHAALIALNAPEAEEVQNSLEAMKAEKDDLGEIESGKKNQSIHIHDLDVIVDSCESSIHGASLDEI